MSGVQVPYSASSLRINNMSLISQTDREMVIEALEYYVRKLKEDNCTPASISAFQTLLNWIELEHFKHEN
jgi:aspartate aminotransferase-like enzyme